MTARPMTITIPAEGKVACARGYQAAQRLREAGRRPVFTIMGWTINLSGLGDVIAYLEHREIAFKIEDQRDDVVVTRPGHHVDGDHRVHEGLWPDGGDAA